MSNPKTLPGLADLMSEAWRLREVLDPNVADDRYDPKVHLARRYQEVLRKLEYELELKEAVRGAKRLEVNVGGRVLIFQVKERGGVWVREIKMNVTRCKGCKSRSV